MSEPPARSRTIAGAGSGGGRAGGGGGAGALKRRLWRGCLLLGPSPLLSRFPAARWQYGLRRRVSVEVMRMFLRSELVRTLCQADGSIASGCRCVAEHRRAAQESRDGELAASRSLRSRRLTLPLLVSQTGRRPAAARGRTLRSHTGSARGCPGCSRGGRSQAGANGPRRHGGGSGPGRVIEVAVGRARDVATRRREKSAQHGCRQTRLKQRAQGLQPLIMPLPGRRCAINAAARPTGRAAAVGRVVVVVVRTEIDDWSRGRA
eukprot:scaffold564_cov101-Isochrysis_galbana.AAC.7